MWQNGIALDCRSSVIETWGFKSLRTHQSFEPKKNGYPINQMASKTRFSKLARALLTRDSVVECLTVNQVVAGSIPAESATNRETRCKTVSNIALSSNGKTLDVLEKIRVQILSKLHFYTTPRAEDSGLSLKMSPCITHLFWHFASVAKWNTARRFERRD